MSDSADAPVVPPITGYPFKKEERKAKPVEPTRAKKVSAGKPSRLPHKGVFSNKNAASIITDKDRATQKPLLESPVQLSSDNDDNDAAIDEVFDDMEKGNDFSETRTSSGSTSPSSGTNPPPQDEPSHKADHVLNLKVDPCNSTTETAMEETHNVATPELLATTAEKQAVVPASTQANQEESQPVTTVAPEQATADDDEHPPHHQDPVHQTNNTAAKSEEKKPRKATRSNVVTAAPSGVKNTKRVSVPAADRSGGSTSNASYPKGFEEYVEEGRKKREKLEAEEKEQEQKSSVAPSFQPSITPLAQKQRKVSSTTAFAALATEWDEQRKRKIRVRSEALKQQEREAIEKTKFKNKETNRILSRRSTYTAGEDGALLASAAGGSGDGAKGASNVGRRESAFERLELDKAKREANQKRLEQKYTPSFTPERITVTERERSKSVHELEDGGSSSGARKQDVEKFYARVMEQRRRSEVKLEKFREEDRNRAAGMKKSMNEVQTFLEKMEQDEAKRKKKLERKAEALHSQEEAGQTFHPSINACSDEMAERARQREEMKKQKESLSREASAPRAAATAAEEESVRSVSKKDRPVNFKEFEARQYRTEEQRQRRMNNLMKEQLESELAECTFRPKLAPRRTPDSSVHQSSTERSPPQQQSHPVPQYVDHKGPSPLVDPLSRSQLKQLDEARVPPLQLHLQQEAQSSPSKIRDADNNASDISFVEQQMSDLEKVLEEWHELEEACS